MKTWISAFLYPVGTLLFMSPVYYLAKAVTEVVFDNPTSFQPLLFVGSLVITAVGYAIGVAYCEYRISKWLHS